MLESPHIFVGAAIAVKVGNPLLAIPLALGSHFVLDMLPHWNPHINTEIKQYGKPTRKSRYLILIDSTLALVAGTFIAASFYPNFAMVATVLLCCLASVLPDVVEIPYYFLGKKDKWALDWIKWQKSIQNDVAMVPGLLSQLIIIIASIAWMMS